MRITIDTDLHAIIVPDSYYMQVDKLNEIISEAGGKKLDYSAYIKTCFEKAYETQVIRSSDIAKARGTKDKHKATGKKADEGEGEKE